MRGRVAAHYSVGWSTVHDATIAHVAAPLAAALPVVRVLGIDEPRCGKPVWTHDPVTGRWVLAHDRWHTGFVDSVGTGGLLAQVKGRSAAVVTGWLADQPGPVARADAVRPAERGEAQIAHAPSNPHYSRIWV